MNSTSVRFWATAAMVILSASAVSPARASVPPESRVEMPAGTNTGTAPAEASPAPSSPGRLVFPGLAGADADAPARGRAEPTAAGTLLSTLLPLAGVLGLAFACAWVARRLARRDGALMSALGAGGRSPAGILEILGRYPLSRAQALILLRVDRRVLLLAQSRGGRAGPTMTTLAEIADPEDVASILCKVEAADGRSMARQFQSLLERARDGEGAVEPELEATDGRRRLLTPDGDAAELWDEARAREATSVLSPARVEQAARVDPVAELRARLAAMAPEERAA
ncbi:MAG: FliO/MopB family protein [Phycisphaerales bacterium]